MKKGDTIQFADQYGFVQNGIVQDITEELSMKDNYDVHTLLVSVLKVSEDGKIHEGYVIRKTCKIESGCHVDWSKVECAYSVDTL